MIDRRGFLSGVLASAGVLTLAACGGGGKAMRVKHADQTGELLANTLISVLATGRIALIVNKAEIGQGVSTGYATLAAEELGVPVDRIDVHLADSMNELRQSGNMQITGGSTSTTEGFKFVRHAAAAAREMLVGAAAAQWGVPARDCTVADGHVVHGTQRAAFGELTKLAARRDVPEHPTLKAAKDFTLIGKTNKRVDARAKVDGSAVFGIDHTVPNMVHAYMIHGPVYGARATRVDAGAAKSRPGVIDVLTVPSGVAIVADKYWQARAAAAELKITWDKGSVAGLDTTQLATAMRTYTEDGASVVDKGNPGKAIKSADAKVAAVYEAPYLSHAPLEPQNAIASVTGSRCEIWAPTQSPTITQAFVSEAIGIDFDDVKVHVLTAGGGFGRRAIADVCAEAAVISKRIKRPVKVIWTRESDMTQAYYRPVFAVHATGGVKQGKIAGAQIHCISQSIPLSSGKLFAAALSGLPGPIRGRVIDAALAIFSTNSFGDIFATEGLGNTPYDFGAYEVAASPVQNKLPVAFWRAVGNSVSGFAMESFVDELCVAAKQDPFAFRRAMLPAKSKQRRVLDALEKLSGWSAPPAKGIGRGVARHFAFETEVGEVAEVELVDGRIRVKRVYCVVDCGIAVNPDIVRAQMEGGIIFGLSAALDQEITLVDGVVQQTNYDTFPSLRMHEAPEVIVEILQSDEPPTGVGEPGLPPIAAAVANAIHTLTGVRLRRMPLQRAWNERGAA